MGLRDLQIRRLKPKKKIYSCADDSGLYIEVHPNGSKLWRFKFRFGGKQKRLALGKYPKVNLSQARRSRDEAKELLEDGIDPLHERKREKNIAAFNASNTFGDIAKELIDKMVAEERATATITKANWLLKKLKPISTVPVVDLKPVDILAVLKHIEAKKHYETARRCRSFTSRVFRYAVATGRAEADPASLLSGALIAPKVKHHAAILDPEQLGEILRAIDHYAGNAITRLALQITPHVMARPGELRKAKWQEFDVDRMIWKVPAERMKMRRSHEVPLSRQVLAYLAELYPLSGSHSQPSGFLFPAFHTTLRPMSENTINQAIRRMGYAKDEVTAHGFRTTASTLLNESGMWSSDAIERSLAHADSNSIRGIYNRGKYWEERVVMHQWWSDYLDELRQSRTGHGAMGPLLLAGRAA